MPKLSTIFEKIISHASGNLASKVRSLSLPYLLLLYRISVNNRYYNYLINAEYNYCISDKVLHDECDKEDNEEVGGGCYHLLLEKKTVKRFVQSHVLAQSPPGPHPMTNIQSTLHIAPDLYKNVSLAVLFGSKGNSHTVSTQLQVSVYTHILHSMETLVGQTK